MNSFDLPSGAAYIVIVTSTFIAWTFLVILIRIFLRLKVNGPLGWDDYACAAATVFGLVNASLTLEAVRWGLGYRVEDIPKAWLDHFYFYIWLFQIFYIIALGFTMASVSLLVCRITRYRTQLLLGYLVTGLAAIWTVVSAILVALQCKQPRPWEATGTSNCPVRWPAWLFSDTVNVVTELCLLAIAVSLVWQVQMSLKHKIKIVIGFALRLAVLPPMIIRLKYQMDTFRGHDPTHDRIDIVLLNEVTMHLSIMLATIPCARPFFAVLEGGAYKTPHDPKVPNAMLQSTRTAQTEVSKTRSSIHRISRGITPTVTWKPQVSIAKPSILPVHDKNPERAGPPPSRWR